MNDYKVLIIDDDTETQSLLLESIKDLGSPHVCSSIKDAQKELKKFHFNVIILNTNFVQKPVQQLCIQIRKNKKYNKTPIFSTNNITNEYNSFIDNYIELHADPMELKNELKSKIEKFQGFEVNEYEVDGIELNLQTKEVFIKENSTMISLTDTEFDILYTLATQPDIVLTDNQIKENALLTKSQLNVSIDKHLNNIKMKLKDFGNRLVFIHGVGYKFETLSHNRLSA